MFTRTIFTSENKLYRIVEHLDEHADLDNLKGDVYNPKHMLEMHGPDMTEEKLAGLERDFEEEVNSLGVYGYVLERWNPMPNCGWEHVDSCWGFVGPYSNTAGYNHYIVEELKSRIELDGKQLEIIRG